MASLIIPDVNVLIYAHNLHDPRHSRARAWLTQLLSGRDRAAFCWETVHGFIRLSSSSSVMTKPLSLTDAFRAVHTWLDTSNSVLLERTARHFTILEKISTTANLTGRTFSDAVLAATAIEHNATLATTDSDFKRFKDLKWFDPLTTN